MLQATTQVIGVDLGDRWTHMCALDRETGEVLWHRRVATERTAMASLLSSLARAQIVMETGTHALWVARLAMDVGHDAQVVDARRVRSITHDVRKSDRRDAEMLARLARADLGLLHPIRVRSAATHLHRSHLRARHALVRMRTLAVNAVRGIAKSHCVRLPSGWSTEVFGGRAASVLEADLLEAVAVIVENIEDLTRSIRVMDRQLEVVAAEAYGEETELLREIHGVGPITSLAYVLAIEDPRRFARSRDVAAYLGLVPKRSQSGEQDPRLGITKTGDRYVRQLLVSAAVYVINRGPDCALQRWGRALRERGGRAPGKRAATAVARKLAVLMHRMWVTGECYDARRGIENDKETKQAA
jgi:transposase